jgi:transposase
VPGPQDVSREDLLALIGELRAVNATLLARVGEQDERIAEQDLRAARQDERIMVQDKRIAELERAVSRNSGNSSMPPSTDDLPGRKTPSRRPGKGGKRGKRPGAAGSGLAWVADPTLTLPHYPGGACGCGADLAEATDEGVARSHQVHEVPLVSRTITQHDLHRVRCTCGRVHVGARPEDVQASPVSYGPNLRALVVYLMVFQHVPIERCARLVADLTGATPSTGFIHRMITRAGDAVADVVTLIKTLITAARVAGFDETTLRAGAAGTRKYVLSASTEACTLYWLGGRDIATFTEFGVLPAFTGIAVHDRYALYDHPDLTKTLTGHQLCCSHLLRDLADAGECHPAHHWPEQITRALRGLIRAANTARDGGLRAVPAYIADPLILELRRGVRVGLSLLPRCPGPASTTKQLPGRLLLECLRDREQDVLRFAADTQIPATNNASERDLRPLKTQQKISGRLQSEDITRDRLAIRSYISTAAKHGINVMTALRQAISGDPWMPPTPAST